MDSRQFDEIARLLGERGSRRRWLAAAAGLGAAARGGTPAGAACSADLGEECVKDAQCCRGICRRRKTAAGKPPKPGRCACLGQNAECGRPSQCCGILTCYQGRCQGPGGGSRERCGPASCGTGCCAGRSCVRHSRQSAAQCGSNGDRCVACPDDKLCVNGACANPECNAGSCPDGCCAADNSCRPFAYENVDACGSGGIACEVCGQDQCCNPEGCGFCL